MLSIEEAGDLPPEQRELVADHLNAEDIARGERALGALLQAGQAAAARISKIARDRGLTSLRILSPRALGLVPDSLDFP